MASDITLEDYLKKDPSIREAAKVLSEAQKALAGARSATPDVLEELRSIESAAQQSYNKLVSQAKEYFKKNYIGISTSGISESITKLEASKRLARDQDTVDSIQASIDSLKEQLRNPKSYDESIIKPKKDETKAKKDKGSKDTGGTQESAVDVDSFTKSVEVAGQKIANMSPEGLKELAKNLNRAYGINLPVNGIYSPDLKNAYIKALSDNLVRSLDFNRTIPFEEFLIVAGNEGTYRSSSASEPSITGSISDPTRAAGLINATFKTQLNREPTAAEVAKYTKILNSAEKKNPFKTVKGITTGGLDKEQFLKDQIAKLPEFAKKKADTRSLTVQTLQSTANANGVILSPEQLNQYALDVQNGKDVKVIQSQIRNLAGLGMPDNVKKLLAEGTDLDTIYSPYKQTMAAVLELNPTTISFTDPVLRSAIGPNGETPLYDFQRALRKDARWQYTNNAREDVFQSVNKVLQDFGFQG